MGIINIIKISVSLNIWRVKDERIDESLQIIKDSNAIYFLIYIFILGFLKNIINFISGNYKLNKILMNKELVSSLDRYLLIQRVSSFTLLDILVEYLIISLFVLLFLFISFKIIKLFYKDNSISFFNFYKYLIFIFLPTTFVYIISMIFQLILILIKRYMIDERIIVISYQISFYISIIFILVFIYFLLRSLFVYFKFISIVFKTKIWNFFIFSLFLVLFSLLFYLFFINSILVNLPINTQTKIINDIKTNNLDNYVFENEDLERLAKEVEDVDYSDTPIDIENLIANNTRITLGVNFLHEGTQMGINSIEIINSNGERICKKEISTKFTIEKGNSGIVPFNLGGCSINQGEEYKIILVSNEGIYSWIRIAE